jgi:hypothetical protein
VECGDVLEEGERVLWESGPRPRRIFAIQDLFLVPLSLAWATGVVVFNLEAPGMAWPVRLVAFASAAYLTVGRFFYKWLVKTRTRYLVTDRRALVCRGGQVYEQQELAGVKPEISGWDHNRIVTFGDALESFMVNLGKLRGPEGNVGMQPGRFTVRRGDGSNVPIRFYDLDPGEADELMSILKSRPLRKPPDAAIC